MPGRIYQLGSGSYRYSMNGQEKSDELNPNLTTAQYWEYDSRLGRRWNVDPKTSPTTSGYSTFFGNPITHVDILGDTPVNPSLATKNGTDYGAWSNMIFPKAPYNILNSANNRFSMHDFEIQKLSDADGAKMNLDFFSLKIDQLPPGFDVGSLFTSIRTNFEQFMDNRITSLEGYDAGETKIWYSQNPISSIMRFKGYHFGINVDDADVITSQYSYSANAAYWVFTPIYDHSTFSGDNGHPLAGNREFGIAPSRSGSGYIFYTQGIDRLYGITDIFAKKMHYDFFADAQRLWTNVMGNIANYINQAGGKASFNSNDIISKRIDYEKGVNKKDRNAVMANGF